MINVKMSMTINDSSNTNCKFCHYYLNQNKNFVKSVVLCALEIYYKPTYLKIT